MKLPKVGISIVLILVPLMLLVLPLPPNKGKWGVHKQDFILVGALLLAALSAAAYFIPNRLFSTRSVWPLILLGTSLLLSANIVWNKQFRDYAGDHPEYRREVFRRAMVLTLHWPIYGRYDNAIARFETATGGYSFSTLPAVGISLAILVGWFMWASRRPLEKPWHSDDFAVLIAFMLATMLAFTFCEASGERRTNRVSGYNEFSADLHRFKSVPTVLRNYVERMPTLRWYGQHYPPGNLILLKIEERLGVPQLTKALVMLLTALTVVPLYKLARRELEFPETASSAAILLFAASTTILILCTINTTSLLVFPATMCLWMLVRGLRRGSTVAAALLGVFYFGYLMFSFSASIVGVLMALITVIAWAKGVATTRNVLVTAAVSIVALVTIIALTYLPTRLNLVACFIAAVRGHQDQQGNGGFDDVRRYLLRSTGNTIAYLTSTVPLCILAISAGLVRRSAPLQRAFFVSIVTTIFIAGFSGLFYLETERIWVFLTPALALAAGHEAARRVDLEGRGLFAAMFLLVLLITCTQEFFFMHYR